MEALQTLSIPKGVGHSAENKAQNLIIRMFYLPR